MTACDDCSARITQTDKEDHELNGYPRDYPVCRWCRAKSDAPPDEIVSEGAAVVF